MLPDASNLHSNYDDTLFQTFTGQQINLLNPYTHQIDIVDIATSLSRQCRFRGHCLTFYTNCQHSIFASQLGGTLGCTPEMQLALLLHDAAEAYVGDELTLIKHRCHYDLSPATQTTKSFSRRRDVESAITHTIIEGLLARSDLSAFCVAHDMNSAHIANIVHDELNGAKFNSIHGLVSRIELVVQMGHYSSKTLSELVESEALAANIMATSCYPGREPSMSETRDTYIHLFKTLLNGILNSLAGSPSATIEDIQGKFD
jgi:hypothetical protein